ncbi:MAG: hypothetical protein QM302_02670 [Acidobacteriota bacterium]|nr:hypothetical protein [Acidobacteriota bacterium]
MAIDKPLPLMVGDKAYYSLTSYGPVEITVDVPHATDEDIDLGLEMTVADLGGSPADLDDPAWVAEHFEGLGTREQVRESVRQQVLAMNERIAEDQKLGKCVEALAARLGQSVPPRHLEEARQVIRMRFTQQLQADGITLDQFLASTGTTTAQLEELFDQQARQMAEGDAALSAYAHERQLKVDEHEIGRLLGLPSTEARAVIEQARAAGRYDELQEAALRSKAAQIAAAECSCTYHHETPEQARRRVAQYRQLRREFDRQLGDDGQRHEPGEDEAGFKLV